MEKWRNWDYRLQRKDCLELPNSEQCKTLLKFTVASVKPLDKLDNLDNLVPAITPLQSTGQRVMYFLDLLGIPPV
ncbi:hypothetical protein DUI87_16382 [Hirundo rustica rustica]|uniref:Uncharacterized protein n=1 Tax=Hirundo rustica rustica TaxID=333673 RepID=A0A3M0K3E6_HIRRU|nr:hypothetical protein DUI87_16382 [Hirundo rustica rustica]